LSLHDALPIWANCWATRCSRTPAPMVLLDRLWLEAANTSPNSPREALKPALLELAMLLEVMLRSADAAFMPLSEIRKLMVCSLEGSPRRQPMRWTADSGTLPMPERLRSSPLGSIETLSTRALARMGSSSASLADGSVVPVTARKL